MRRNAEPEDQIGEEDRSGTLLGRATAAARTVGEKVQRSAEVMTGADIRRFDEFTSAATTAVIGIHQDQAEVKERLIHVDQVVSDLQDGQVRLSERLDRVERSTLPQTVPKESRGSLSPVVIAFGAVSVVALLLSIASIVAGSL